MQKKSTTPKQLSGGRRRTLAGLTGSTVYCTPEEMDRIRAAAQAEKRPVTQFLLHYGLMAAEKYFAKSAKST